MTWGAVAGGAVGLIGGMMSSDAAGDAAAAQQQASQMSSALQYQAAQQMRQDLSPWVDQGRSANALLGRYLGLGLGPSAVTSAGLKTGLNPDEVRQQLLSRYTSTVANPMNSTSDPAYADAMRQDSTLGYGGVSGAGVDYTLGQDGERIPVQKQSTAPQYIQQVDEAGLNAAIQQYYKEQADLQAKAEQDPTYGSLLTPYKNGQEFSFTGQDLQNEPGYQFGLEQGEQGINRGLASRGSFLSGAAMKQLSRYNQDYAGTKFNDAYNRALGTWNTNKSAYDSNRDRIYSFLSGQSTMGQNSAAQVGTTNQQYARSAGENALAAGNSAAAGIIGSSNALQSGMNQATNNINSAGGWNALLGGKPSIYAAGGSAGAGWGSGAAFGNQDLGLNF